MIKMKSENGIVTKILTEGYTIFYLQRNYERESCTCRHFLQVEVTGLETSTGRLVRPTQETPQANTV
jgi:hypothetical protein